MWLINENGEILLARRAAHMSTDAGVWGPSVSGKVDAGETADQAVLREAQEELGLETNAINPIFLHNETYTEHSDGRVRQFSLYYAVLPSNTIKHLELEPNEVSEIKWFKRDDLKQLVDQKSDNIIISSTTQLWQSIFVHLQPITT